jgi:hypothetical protein
MAGLRPTHGSWHGVCRRDGRLIVGPSYRRETVVSVEALRRTKKNAPARARPRVRARGSVSTTRDEGVLLYPQRSASRSTRRSEGPKPLRLSPPTPRTRKNGEAESASSHEATSNESQRRKPNRAQAKRQGTKPGQEEDPNGEKRPKKRDPRQFSCVVRSRIVPQRGIVVK